MSEPSQVSHTLYRAEILTPTGWETMLGTYESRQFIEMDVARWRKTTGGTYRIATFRRVDEEKESDL